MGRTGMVYITALVAVLVIAGSAMVMARGTAVELQARRRAHELTACRLAAEGMLRAICIDLDASLSDGGLPGLSQVVPDGEEIGDCLVYLTARNPIDGGPTFDLQPQAALIDINHTPPARLARLLDDQALAAAIVDWRDADDEPVDGLGAESSDGWYAAATVPYAPRNAPFEHRGELRLLRGMDDERYFGEDVNRNGGLDEGEDSNANGSLDTGLRDLVSLENREPATAPDGRPRVSVNRLDRDFRSLLVDRLGAARGEACYAEALARQPFANRLEFLVAIDFADQEIVALWPSLIGSEGRLGLIDAWSCSEELLLNAVGSELAETIIDARPARRPADALWLVRGLDREQAAHAGMLLTNGSYRVRADIVAVHRSGRSWYRLEAEIDCSAGIARVLRLQPAQRHGWPFGWVRPEALPALGDDLPQVLGNPR